MFSRNLCNHGVVVLILVLTRAWIVSTSTGDKLPVTRQCIELCYTAKCKVDLKKFEATQPLTEKLLLWTCEDDCRYDCMWQTVDLFVKQGQSVPQFHGKWPFVRFLGIQEPASMIFSIMNGAAHTFGLWLYLSAASRSSPLFYPSVTFGVLAINAWFWSSVFHSRDFPITEKLDYFSATAALFYSIYYCIHRVSFGLAEPNPHRGWFIRVLASFFLLSFYIYHVAYLSLNRFDYGYNMFVNVVAGLCNGFVWVWYHVLTRSNFSHQWRATYAVVYTMFLLFFELVDFVPIFWILDGHALWHLGTILFPLLWYPFMIHESRIVEDIKFKIV